MAKWVVMVIKTMQSTVKTFKHQWLQIVEKYTSIVIRNRKIVWKVVLDRVLFAAELEFSKILVPRLSQHTSDVNIECAGESDWSKQLYRLYVTSFLEH